MRQRPFVFEHLSKIAAIDPARAGWAFDEMLGLARITHQQVPKWGAAFQT